MTPVPLLTPTPLPLGTLPIDLSEMQPQVIAGKIAMDTVGLWNQGVDDLWAYVSALLLVVLVMLAIIAIYKHIQRME